jgi:hypothetical protein
MSDRVAQIREWFRKIHARKPHGMRNEIAASKQRSGE